MFRDWTVLYILHIGQFWSINIKYRHHHEEDIFSTIVHILKRSFLVVYGLDRNYDCVFGYTIRNASQNGKKETHQLILLPENETVVKTERNKKYTLNTLLYIAGWGRENRTLLDDMLTTLALIIIEIRIGRELWNRFTLCNYLSLYLRLCRSTLYSYIQYDIEMVLPAVLQIGTLVVAVGGSRCCCIFFLVGLFPWH